MSGKLMQSIRSIPYWNLVKSFTAVGPSMLDILETKDIIQNKSVLFLTNERTDRNTGEQNTFATVWHRDAGDFWRFWNGSFVLQLNKHGGQGSQSSL
uniref:Uncharacterized protein n=1 Tax=Anguilla anguilla TaxID=7936 RepID=A0A0E9QHX9_ANGAN